MKHALSIFLIALSATLATLPVADAVNTDSVTAPASNEAWARDLVAKLPRATTVNDANGNKLFDTLEAEYAANPLALGLPVIVVFRHDVPTADGVARVRAVAPAAFIERTFTIIPAYSGALSFADALRVGALPEVRQIEFDHPGDLELDSATLTSGANAVVDGMRVTGDMDGVLNNFTAKDIGIAILDTGFDIKHVDLAGGKVIHFEDIGDGKNDVAYDGGNHGTHVASIAAGTGAGDIKYRGVAPGASIIGFKIIGEKGGADAAIASYERVIALKDEFNIRVTTMSFGFGFATDGTSAVELAVDKVWDAGIINFKSTGNSGPDRGTITVPAAARGILSVGAMLDPAGGVAGQIFGFQLATFSSRGPTTDGRTKPDLAAPGQLIMAAKEGTKDEYTEKSGTSMASPFAAGAAALIIATNPALTNAEVADILTSTTEDWGVVGADVDYGAGRIQVREAVLEAFRRIGVAPLSSEAPAVPFHEIRTGSIGAPSPGNPLGAVMAQGTFEVNDTTNPIAGTFIGEGSIVSVTIRDPDDNLLGHFTEPAPSRQHVVSFKPTSPGTYTYVIYGTPMTSFVVDFSHGVAAALVDLPIGPLEGGDVAEEAAPKFTIPGAPVAALIVALGIAVRFRSRK